MKGEFFGPSGEILVVGWDIHGGLVAGIQVI